MPLSNKEHFYRTVLENLQGDIAILDEQHRYLYINPYAIRDPVIREWIIGKTDHDYCLFRGIDPEVAHIRRDKFNRAMETRDLVEWEENFVDREGKNRVFLRRIYPIVNEEQGRVTYMIGHGLEITERRRAREELENYKRFTDAVLNSSPHLIFVKDREGRFLMVNKAVADLFNKTPEAIIHQSNYDVHARKEETEVYNSNDQWVLKERRPLRVEEKLTRYDGQVLWYDTIKVPLVEADGTVNVLGISTEITGRKLKDDQLKKRQQERNDAQELTRSGNWYRNMEDDSIEWSRGMYLIWELDPDGPPPLLSNLMQTIEARDVDLVNRMIDEVVSSGEPREFYFSINVPSGIKILRALARPVADDSGSINGLFGSVIDVTFQKLAEEKLRLSEEQLNEAQEMSKTGNFEFDLVTGNISWSRGMYRIWEMKEEDGPLNVERFIQYVHKDDLPQVLQSLDKMMEFENEWTLSYRIVTPKGSIKHINVISRFHHDHEGRKVKLIGACQDITEAQQFRETIKLNEQRLIEAQELANMGSWEIDLYPSMNIRWSQGNFKIWELDDAHGAPNPEDFFQHIHEEDKETLINTFKHLIKTGEDIKVRFRATTYNGNPKIFLGKGKARFSHEGKVERIYGTTIDITEQERTREILQLNEERLIQAQEIAKLGSWQFDLRTGEMDWTKGTYRIVERNEEDPILSMKEFRSYIHPDDVERFNEAMLLATRSMEEQSIEFRLLLKNKPLKYLEVRSRGIREPGGEITKLFGTVRDITEHKLAEEEIIRARQEAEESMKAKENFLANISHELRTPLNGILGMSRLLNKTALNATQREYIDVLSTAAANLQVIISDILDFTKIEAGKLMLEEVDFDPVRIADNAIQLQMEKAEEKNLSLRHLHTGQYRIPSVVGDPHRLSQILLNLLSNAIKFTNHGEVVLSHMIVDEDQHHVRVHFMVKDTGIGIPASMHHRIFESFTQLEHTNGINVGGLGLGLSITKSLVERQGGKIWVESEMGEGSVFHFIIPYRKASLLPDQHNKYTSETPALGTLSVLLAEDNKVNQFLTESLLLDWGFTVDLAVNGAEAVQLAATNEYDIILMDIQMPEMDGMEATRVIRRLSDRRKSAVPIIALTANTSRQAHRQFLTEGMNDWLVKPFLDEALYRKIARHLAGREWKSKRRTERKFPVRRRPEADASRLYDLSMLSRNTPENPAFIKRMLGIFIETIPPIVERMKYHFDRAEMDEVSALAHKIKPTLDGAGIISLRETIRNLELYRDRKRNRQNAEDDLKRLCEVIKLVTAEFHKEIEKIG